MSFTPRLVFVTAPSLAEARNLAQALLDQRLAACVNLVPTVESHYRWQGKLETATEVLMLIKTSAEKFEKLAGLIRERHSYECAEIVAVAPGEIAPSYLAWWQDAMQTDPMV